MVQNHDIIGIHIFKTISATGSIISVPSSEMVAFHYFSNTFNISSNFRSVEPNKSIPVVVLYNISLIFKLVIIC